MTTTREIAKAFLTRLARGDAAQTAAIFADEVDFLCAGSKDVPWIRPRDTREDMEDLFDSLQSAFVPEDRAAELTLFLIEGDEAVIMGHIRQRLCSNGREMAFPFALRLTVEAGKITRYHIYEDSLAVADAVRAG